MLGSCSVTPCLSPLRQGLSLNLELGKPQPSRPSSRSHPPVFIPNSAGLTVLASHQRFIVMPDPHACTVSLASTGKVVKFQ